MRLVLAAMLVLLGACQAEGAQPAILAASDPRCASWETVRHMLRAPPHRERFLLPYDISLDGQFVLEIWAGEWTWTMVERWVGGVSCLRYAGPLDHAYRPGTSI